MKKRKIMYTIFFILLITITCVVVNINRKEQNKTEEKKIECAEMQLFEYPTQYSQVSGNHYFYCKRSIVSILTKKYLIASRQVLVCGNDPAVFLTKAIDLPENSDPCHPYDLGFLTANIQNNRMV